MKNNLHNNLIIHLIRQDLLKNNARGQLKKKNTTHMRGLGEKSYNTRVQLESTKREIHAKRNYKSSTKKRRCSDFSVRLKRNTIQEFNIKQCNRKTKYYPHLYLCYANLRFHISSTKVTWRHACVLGL